MEDWKNNIKMDDDKELDFNPNMLKSLVDKYNNFIKLQDIKIKDSNQQK